MTDTSFRPGPETRTAYREALGCFGTGVTVVTAMSGSRPLGITANSFASVSLTPPLVLWCAARTSLRHDIFVSAERYLIHVMSEAQQDLALQFARSGHDFDTVDWQLSDTGLPVLAGCLARFECTRHAVHPAGDHSVILGQVDQVTYRPGKGLMFKRGQYGGFAGLT